MTASKEWSGKGSASVCFQQLDLEAFGGCAGVVCLKAHFSYEFGGPPDPFYDHAEVCGEALVFTVQPTKILAFGKNPFTHTRHAFPSPRQ